MKHWISLVNVAEVDQYLEIAKFAEEVGFHGITIADHLVMPLNLESRYPYTPDGKMWWPEDTPWPDPWVTLAAMSAVTKKLEFSTNIYLAALRDPFTAAKAISTAAVISNNRVVCGLSAGWIKEEYEMLGVDFDSRGRRLDEIITIMKKFWTGKPMQHQGEFFTINNALMSPAPTKPIRVWSGGASKSAFRRAINNDGWLGVPMAVAPLERAIQQMQAQRKEAGKENTPFDICCSLIEPLTADVQARLENLGAHNNMVLPWVITPWGRSAFLKEDEQPADLEVKKRVMERYAKKVIHR